jgi:O-antigen/teichoic acid export membrane protein
VLATLVTRFAVLPLGLLQGALLARGLGPEGLGRYSAALVDVNIVTTLLALGLPGGLAVLVGESQGDPPATRRLWQVGLRHILLALLLATALGIAIGLLFPSLIYKIDADRTPLIMGLLTLCICGQLGRDLHNALLWGGQRFSVQNRLGLVLSILQLLAVVVLFLLTRLSVGSALLLQALSLWGLCLAFGWRLRLWLSEQRPLPQTPNAVTPLANSPSTKRLYLVSLRNFLHILPDMLLLRIDVYLIELLLPAPSMSHELGLYQAGVRVAELLLLLPGTLNAVLFAKAAAREQVAEQALVSAKLCLYLGLLGCLGMFLVGKPLLLLFYGPRFAGSFVPCLLVLSGCAALSFSGPLAGTLSGDSGYPVSVIAAQGIALVTNVGLNLWLLPKLGIVGAAWASAGAYAVSAACISLGFARRFQIPLGRLLAPISRQELRALLTRRSP